MTPSGSSISKMPTPTGPRLRRAATLELWMPCWQNLFSIVRLARVLLALHYSFSKWSPMVPFPQKCDLQFSSWGLWLSWPSLEGIFQLRGKCCIGRSLAGNHSGYGFMNVTAVSCAEDSISQYSFPFSGSTFGHFLIFSFWRKFIKYLI